MDCQSRDCLVARELHHFDAVRYKSCLKSIDLWPWIDFPAVKMSFLNLFGSLRLISKVDRQYNPAQAMSQKYEG